MNKDDEHFLACVAETGGEAGGGLRMKNSVLEILRLRCMWNSQAEQVGKRERSGLEADLCVSSIQMELTPLANVKSMRTGTCYITLGLKSVLDLTYSGCSINICGVKE